MYDFCSMIPGFPAIIFNLRDSFYFNAPLTNYVGTGFFLSHYNHLKLLVRRGNLHLLDLIMTRPCCVLVARVWMDVCGTIKSL